MIGLQLCVHDAIKKNINLVGTDLPILMLKNLGINRK